MNRGVLVYRELVEGVAGGGAVLVALHGNGSGCSQLGPFAGLLEGRFRTIALEAPLPVSPLTARHDGGHVWFPSDDRGTIEPVAFGDSLYQVEQFIIELSGAPSGGTGAQRVFLIGVEEGGVLALALACLWPELVGGVVSICGHLPDIPGWNLPDGDLNSMPVLLVDDPSDAALSEMTSRCAAVLTNRGGTVSAERIGGARQLPATMLKTVSTWLLARAPR
jgi:predicted esterase